MTTILDTTKLTEIFIECDDFCKKFVAVIFSGVSDKNLIALYGTKLYKSWQASKLKLLYPAAKKAF